MRISFRCASAVALSAAVLATAAPPVTAAPPTSRTVYVTVTTESGEPVGDLDPVDFVVKEGGKEREVAKSNGLRADCVSPWPWKSGWSAMPRPARRFTNS